MTTVHYPKHGFSILWNSTAKYDDNSSGRLGIQISAVKPVDFSTDVAEPEEAELQFNDEDETQPDDPSEETPLLPRRPRIPPLMLRLWLWLTAYLPWLELIYQRLVSSAPAKALSTEIFLYIPFSLAESRVMGNSQQKEIFIPIINTQDGKSLINQCYEIDPQHNYRVRVSLVTRSGRIVDTSNWSSEVAPGLPITFTDLPFEFLRLVAPAKISSLNAFLQLHTQQVSAFVMPITLSQISLLVHMPQVADELATAAATQPRFFTIRVFVSRNSAQARATATRTGRKVFDEIRIAAIPMLPSQKVSKERVKFRSEGLVEFAAEPFQKFELERTRISESLISMEVLDTITGQLVSTGSIDFGEVGQLVWEQFEPMSTEVEFHVQLSNATTSGFWGDVSMRLDMKRLERLVRHTRGARVLAEEEESDGCLPTLERGSALNPALFPKQSQRPYFINDLPGKAVLQGSTVMLNWVWPGNDAPSQIYLYLLCNQSDELVGSLQFGHAVPNTGNFQWIADAVFQERKNPSLEVYIMMTVQPWESIPASSRRLALTHPQFCVAQSNTFFLVKALPLCELEMAYAGFCRSHLQEMERISPSSLERDWDYNVVQCSLRICKNLRHRLPFEDEGVLYYHTPGQCVVSSFSKMVLHSRLQGASTLQKSRMAGLSQFSQGNQLEVYKSVSAVVQVLEGCLIVPSNDNWRSSMHRSLLQKDLAYQRPILDFLSSLIWSLPARWNVIFRLRNRVSTGPKEFPRWDELEHYLTLHEKCLKYAKLVERHVEVLMFGVTSTAVERSAGFLVNWCLVLYQLAFLNAFPFICVALIAVHDRLAIVSLYYIVHRTSTSHFARVRGQSRTYPILSSRILSGQCSGGWVG